MHQTFALDGRLASAASFVRQGARFADIGTDHAYLPIRLLLDGKIESAVACDINAGPLEKATANIAKYRLQNKIECRLGNGLAPVASSGITDAAICGMGGELIARIIEDAPFVRDSSVRLILQPMTHQGHLRRYLLSSGFSIVGEALSEADGKIYQCICAEFSACNTEYSPAELEIGRQDKDSVLFGQLLESRIATLEKIICARQGAKCENAEDIALLEEYKEMARKIK